VAIGGRVIPVLLGLTQTVPIIVPGAADPVGTGWIESLARPGRNVTGFSFLEFSILGKMLEILKQLAPAVSRVAMIFNPDNPNSVLFRRAFETFAPPLEIQPAVFTVHGVVEIEHAFASFAERPSSGAFFPPDVNHLEPIRGRTIRAACSSPLCRLRDACDSNATPGEFSHDVTMRDRLRAPMSHRAGRVGDSS